MCSFKEKRNREQNHLPVGAHTFSQAADRFYLAFIIQVFSGPFPLFSD